MPVRLISAADTERMASVARAGFADTATRMRRAFRSALADQGLTGGDDRGPQAAAVWSATAWADAVAAGVEPAAHRIAAALNVTLRRALPNAGRWAVEDPTAVIVALIAGRATAAGVLAARRVGTLDPAGGLVATGGNIVTISQALDSALEQMEQLTANAAAQAANAAVGAYTLAADRYMDATVQNRWSAMMDDHTREDHADADGQYQSPGDPFDVGGEQLWYPGDPNGSDEQTVGCRCWLESLGLDDEVDMPASAREGTGGSESAIAEAGEAAASELAEA